MNNKSGPNFWKTSIRKILVNIKCRKFVSDWLPVVFYAGFIFYLSSLQGPKIPKFECSDKVLHALLYAGFGFVLIRALHPVTRSWSSIKICFVALFAALLYGVSDEFHQSFVPTRAVEVSDVMADGFGGLMGGLFSLVVIYVRRKLNYQKVS